MKRDDSGPRAGRWRVLIIEDESLVAMLLEDALADIGWEVIGIASRFRSADHKARSLAFDVAIVDINLSGKLTFPIAEDLFERGIPFVFATGYGDEIVPARLKSVPVLKKPFGKPDLERTLRAALGANYPLPDAGPLPHAGDTRNSRQDSR